MNKQTKRYRKLGLSRKTRPGQQDPNNRHSGYAVDIMLGTPNPHSRPKKKENRRQWAST